MTRPAPVTTRYAGLVHDLNAIELLDKSLAQADSLTRQRQGEGIRRFLAGLRR